MCKTEDIPYLKIGISRDGGNTLLDEDEMQEALEIAIADESISFTFKKAGEWTVISTVKRPGMPSYQFNSTTTVIEENSKPEIDYINRVDNKYKISWNIPVALQSNLTGISIYRKAPSSPSFIRIVTLPKDAAEYIDSNSDGNQESDGYAIRYELPYGYSKMSEVHIPTCLKLTTFDNLTGWNLTWNAHTGSEVDRYSILRGSTPDSLTEIASVDGCRLSYIDKNAPDGEWFYAVEVILASSQINKISRTLESRQNGILTNVISTHDALKVIPANGIEITNPDKALNYYATPEGIHLSATISPLNATIRKINWSVTEGSELASIDQNGRLISKTPGDGIVRVKAATTDGSELTTEININVTQEKPYIMRDPIINPEGIEHKCYSEFYEADRECNSYYCVGSTTCQGDVMTNIRIADSGRKIYIPARKFGIFPKSEDITLHDVWIEGLVENDTLYIPSWQIVDINENGKKLYLCAYDEDELLPYMAFTYSSTLNSDGSLDGISCWAPGGYVGRSFKLVTNGKIPQVESYHVHPHFIKTYYGTEATIPEEEDIISRDQYLFSYKQSGINHSRTVNAVVDKNGKVYIQGLFDIAPLAWIPFTVSSEGDGLKAVDWDWVDINNGYKYYRVGMSEKMMTDISKVLSYQPYFVFNHGMLEGIAKYPYFHCYTADEEYTYTNYSDVKLTKIGNHSYRSLPANILDASISTTDNLLLSQTSDLNPKLIFSIYVDNFSISDGSSYRNFRYSTDGRIYPVDNLGWKLYVDDTAIPFNQYYFPSLARNLDWVGMNDEFSPYCTMQDHYSQYQYWIPIKNGWQKVELVHTINFNGDISESDKVFVIDLAEAGVDTTLSDDAIVSSEYYDLEGIKITKPVSGGVYLRRTIHQNGHISIEKIITR